LEPTEPLNTHRETIEPTTIQSMTIERNGFNVKNREMLTLEILSVEPQEDFMEKEQKLRQKSEIMVRISPMDNQLFERESIIKNDENDEIQIFNNYYFRKPKMNNPSIEDFKRDPNCIPIPWTRNRPSINQCVKHPISANLDNQMLEDIMNALKTGRRNRREYFNRGNGFIYFNCQMINRLFWIKLFYMEKFNLKEEFEKYEIYWMVQFLKIISLKRTDKSHYWLGQDPYELNNPYRLKERQKEDKRKNLKNSIENLEEKKN
jgi:hypothetical protein